MSTSPTTIISIPNADILRHLGAQVGVAVLVAAVGALAKVDYSSLGAFAGIAQMATAGIMCAVNEWLNPTAPAK